MIFWLGVISYFEEKYTAKTYWLIAIGIWISMFSKLTAGLIVLIVSLLVIVYDMYRTKKIELIFNRNFFLTLPVYLCVLVYFLKIYFVYGSFQPSYSIIAREEYLKSSFYVDESNRVSVLFEDLIKHFFGGIWQTWKATYNGDFMVERNGVYAIGFVVILALFCTKVIYELIKLLRKEKREEVDISIFFWIAIIGTLFLHFITFVSSYKKTGYLGGYQARYYMPCIPIIALYASEFVQFLYRKVDFLRINLIKGLVACLSCWIVYTDFVYFVLKVYNLV